MPAVTSVEGRRYGRARECGPRESTGQQYGMPWTVCKLTRSFDDPGKIEHVLLICTDPDAFWWFCTELGDLPNELAGDLRRGLNAHRDGV